MHDGSTRRLERSELEQAMFLAHHEATLVVVAGTAIGTEYALGSGSQTIGRGPGVDIVLKDDSMSQEHAVNDIVGRRLLLDAQSKRSRQSARQDCILPVNIPDGCN